MLLDVKNLNVGFLVKGKLMHIIHNVNFSLREGEVLFEGQNILKLTQRQWKPLRRDIQIIFQHPQMTFNPRATVYSACREPIRVYHLASNKREEEEMIVSILERVGIAAERP